MTVGTFCDLWHGHSWFQGPKDGCQRCMEKLATELTKLSRLTVGLCGCSVAWLTRKLMVHVLTTLTFRNGQKAYKDKPIPMCTTNAVVNVSDGSIQRPVFNLTRFSSYCRLVTPSDDGNKHCTISFCNRGRNYILEYQGE